jgi:hypothetical protein
MTLEKMRCKKISIQMFSYNLKYNALSEDIINDFLYRAIIASVVNVATIYAEAEANAKADRKAFLIKQVKLDAELKAEIEAEA